jgi:hypothetical protein
MQDSVYGNGTTKVRYQPTEWDDWKRFSEVNSSPHQSVNDAVGRLAMSQMSLDRVLQSRLEELALTKVIEPLLEWIDLEYIFYSTNYFTFCRSWGQNIMQMLPFARTRDNIAIQELGDIISRTKFHLPSNDMSCFQILGMDTA